jgi:hypothetical protein
MEGQLKEVGIRECHRMGDSAEYSFVLLHRGDPARERPATYVDGSWTRKVGQSAEFSKAKHEIVRNFGGGVARF